MKNSVFAQMKMVLTGEIAPYANRSYKDSPDTSHNFATSPQTLHGRIYSDPELSMDNTSEANIFTSIAKFPLTVCKKIYSIGDYDTKRTR